MLSIRTECHGNHTRLDALQSLELFSTVCTPDINDPIHVLTVFTSAARRQKPAVGAESQSHNIDSLFCKGHTLFAGAYVPNPDRVIGTCRGEGFAIRAEGSWKNN